jgi:hypothetical protein
VVAGGVLAGLVRMAQLIRADRARPLGTEPKLTPVVTVACYAGVLAVFIVLLLAVAHGGRVHH